MPTDNSDLGTLYTPPEVLKVATIDGIYVGQSGTDEFLIHEYKNYIGDNSVELNWRGKSTQTATTSPIYLQIYNYGTNQWETLDRDIGAPAGVDVMLAGVIMDPTNYIDVAGVLSSRIWQEAL